MTLEAARIGYRAARTNLARLVDPPPVTLDWSGEVVQAYEFFMDAWEGWFDIASAHGVDPYSELPQDVAR